MAKLTKSERKELRGVLAALEQVSKALVERDTGISLFMVAEQGSEELNTAASTLAHFLVTH